MVIEQSFAQILTILSGGQYDYTDGHAPNGTNTNLISVERLQQHDATKRAVRRVHVRNTGSGLRDTALHATYCITGNDEFTSIAS